MTANIVRVCSIICLRPRRGCYEPSQLSSALLMEIEVLLWEYLGTWSSPDQENPFMGMLDNRRLPHLPDLSALAALYTRAAVQGARTPQTPRGLNDIGPLWGEFSSKQGRGLCRWEPPGYGTKPGT